MADALASGSAEASPWALSTQNAAPPSAPWWALVDEDVLADRLLTHPAMGDHAVGPQSSIARAGRVVLAGWAEEGDPFVTATGQRAVACDSAFRGYDGDWEWTGALHLVRLDASGTETGGVVLMMSTNPQDGYRSSFGAVVALGVERGARPLQTSLPLLPVAFARETEWIHRHDRKGAKRRNNSDSSSVILAVSIDTAGVLAEWGTRNLDDYYPSAVFSIAPQNATAAAPLAAQRWLTAVAATGSTARARAAVRKM